MHATAQTKAEVCSVQLGFSPPVRSESIDLRALVSHRTATQSTASMESVSEIFKNGSANFVTVLEGERLLGMCSRQETAALLGGRYGFSLWARKPIAQHLCRQETRIDVAMAIGDVLHSRTGGARPRDSPEKRADGDRPANGNGITAGAVCTSPVVRCEAIISDVYKFADSTVLTDDACLVAADLQTSASTIQ